jgi:hypothetical protein
MSGQSMADRLALLLDLPQRAGLTQIKAGHGRVRDTVILVVAARPDRHPLGAAKGRGRLGAGGRARFCAGGAAAAPA